MIYFLLSKQNSHTIYRYLKERGRPISGQIGVIHYEDLRPLQCLKCSALIFSDLDIIEGEQLKIVCGIYDEIRKQHPDLTIFNNPHRVKLRYSLLRSLHDSGINPFNIYRPYDNLNDIRFPVFLRQENNHIGALSPLLKNEKALQTYLQSLEMQGWKRKHLLIVEYEDVQTPDGYFVRYAALRIGDEIYPYLIDYDQQWVAKYVDSPLKDTPQYASTYRDFSTNFKDKHLLMTIFEMAGIDYGRIDFSYSNGKPVVWEINLNPDYEYEENAHKHFEKGVREIKRQTNARILSNFRKLNGRKSHRVELDKTVFQGYNDVGSAPGLTKQLGVKIINVLPIKKELLTLKRALYLIWARVVLVLKRRK